MPCRLATPQQADTIEAMVTRRGFLGGLGALLGLAAAPLQLPGPIRAVPASVSMEGASTTVLPTTIVLPKTLKNYFEAAVWSTFRYGDGGPRVT